MATDNEATPVDVGVSDADLFNSTLTDETAETPAVETPEVPADDGQNRDDQGRFAKAETEAKSETTPAETPAQDDDKGGHVPSWRVREINAEKAELAKKLEAEQAERNRLATQFEAMQREVQSLRKPVEQPKEAKPDPLIDPEGYERYIESKFEQRLVSERRETSLRLAHRTYKQEFDEAYTNAQQAMARGDVGLHARIQQSNDPGETLMEWHRQQKTMREVGSDPEAFVAKRLEAMLSDPAQAAKIIERLRGGAPAANGQTQRPNVQLPPSLSSMSRAEGSRGGDDETDLSDEALFKYATR